MQEYEKLGVFYLGQLYDLDEKERLDPLLLYDSRDLVTHAVCVGMTGSGKTGLCVGLLEEAALDGIPAIVIDPKGDLGNLLLTFPELRPSDFRPWINEEDAGRKGKTPDEYAAAQAELWANGLVDWGQDGERIKRLREAADFAIYTPGSTAGRPLSILKSFTAPDASLREDSELLGDKIETTVTGLLGLLGIEADPIQSREHILISTILQEAWRAGRSLDLAALIQAIQQPPVSRIGVMEVDSFYPAKERYGLALKLNNLIASPGFESWLTGEPLDIDCLLYTAEGKPRISIVSIAHLSEPERMFFVSLLLNETVGWMRAQLGTTSLRALIYMDEIFGYFPPVANPPSKKPLLTMLKQARAYGVGVVLATQNPVDLDYKGLSNTGTWFIGRLQTERDKARVLEGLEGAAAGTGATFNKGDMEETLAGLGKRVFLMNNVHDGEPAVFQTRWAMSYLRGPLTRREIKRLTGDVESAAVQPLAPATVEPSTPSVRPAVARPVLPPKVPEHFVPVRQLAPAAAGLHYDAALLSTAQYRCDNRKAGVSVTDEITVLVPMTTAPMAVDWNAAARVDIDASDLMTEPENGAVGYGEVPAAGTDSKSYTAWKSEWKDWIYRSQAVKLWHSPTFKEYSEPGESERDFRIRLQQSARERRDEEKEKLTKKYTPKIARIEERIRKAQQAVEREEEQSKQQKLQTAISVGTTVLGSILGRKTLSRTSLGRATTAARGVGRTMKEAGDITRAKETVAAKQQELQELDAEFREEIEALKDRFDPMVEELEDIEVRPLKKDIAVGLVSLAWVPHWEDAQGNRTPAWE
jgi:hypothetical protein